MCNKMTENVEVKQSVITFAEASEMCVKDLLESKIAIETAIRMHRETTTCRNKYYLIGAIRSLVNGVGKGYIKEDYYAPTRYYTSGDTDYAIQGVKNIRIADTDDKTKKVCVAKITAPSGKLLPAVIYVDGRRYETRFIASDHFCEVIDY